MVPTQPKFKRTLKKSNSSLADLGLTYKTNAQLPRILDSNGICVSKYDFLRNGWYAWVPDSNVDGISSQIKHLINSNFFDTPPSTFVFDDQVVTFGVAKELLGALRFNEGCLSLVDLTKSD